MQSVVGLSGLVEGPLKAFAGHAGALSSLLQRVHLPLHSRGLSSSAANNSNNGGERHSSLYVTDVENNPISHMPLLLGLVNYFERHMPYGEMDSTREVCSRMACCDQRLQEDCQHFSGSVCL